MGGNDVYVSPKIEAQLEEYKQFIELNTGTVFAINCRHPVVLQWLQSAWISLFNSVQVILVPSVIVVVINLLF